MDRREARNSGRSDLGDAEADDAQLRRRPAQVTRDDEEVGRVLGRERRLGGRRRKACLDLEPACRTARDRARRDPPSGDEERPPERRLAWRARGRRPPRSAAGRAPRLASATSSSAPMRSRSRAASSKRRARASRGSLARSAGRADPRSSPSKSPSARAASWARRLLETGPKRVGSETTVQRSPRRRR